MQLNKALMFVGAGVVLSGSGFVIYQKGKGDAPKPSVTQASVKDTDKTNTTNTSQPKTDTAPTDKQKNISEFPAAGLFNASYTNKPKDFTPWSETQTAYEYRDFNGDKVDDVFVWGKLVGTAGFSYAAVWTVENDQPIELWHVPDSLMLEHSTWEVKPNNGLENKSLNSDGSTKTSQTFHWQVSTSGKGFVLEPGI
jgi:hypothetical protein